TLPRKPVSATMTKNLIAATVLGVVLGVALAYWTEYHDNSIKTLKEAQAFIQLPILATVPSVSTEEELIKKRRVSMLLTVLGTFYALFLIILLIRELLMSYSPTLLYLETYKEWLFKLKEMIF
ncbi:MAG: hypothetical protein ACE5GM_11020, partial [bacterium]